MTDDIHRDDPDAVLAAAATRSQRSRRAWATRRAIERGERPPMRPARARVTVVDGPYAGRVLLLDRSDVTRDEWGVPGAMYRFVDAAGTRLAYVDRADPFVPVIGWRGWTLSTAAPSADEYDDGLTPERVAAVMGVPVAILRGMPDDPRNRGRRITLPLLKSGHGDMWPGGAPLAAACDVMVRPAPTNAPLMTRPAHDDPAPGFDCNCGIYSTMTHYTLEEAGHAGHEVVGLLAGWGKIVHHGGGMESYAGYRVARAYPVLMVLTGTADDWRRLRHTDRNALVRDLRRAYRVPVAASDPARVYDTIVDYVTRPDNALPTWVYRCLPPDLRAAGIAHDRKIEEGKHGGG